MISTVSQNLLNTWLNVGSKYLALGILVVNEKGKKKKKRRKRKKEKIIKMKKKKITGKLPTIHLKQVWKSCF